MGSINVQMRTGETVQVEIEVGESLMASIRDSGIDEMYALCGGACACATCHIIFDDESLAKLPPMSEDEDAMLDCTSERSDNSRLACQIQFDETLDGVKVMIAGEE